MYTYINQSRPPPSKLCTEYGALQLKVLKWVVEPIEDHFQTSYRTTPCRAGNLGASRANNSISALYQIKGRFQCAFT